jgi:hypothetical protein
MKYYWYLEKLGGLEWSEGSQKMKLTVRLKKSFSELFLKAFFIYRKKTSLPQNACEIEHVFHIFLFLFPNKYLNMGKFSTLNSIFIFYQFFFLEIK